MEGRRTVRVTVNEVEHEREVEVRKTLAAFLREDLGLRGTHLGCEHGVCGACTILLNDASVRSCIVHAVQADGADTLTVRRLCSGGGRCTRSRRPSGTITGCSAVSARRAS